jgi:hypothetical protein
MADITIDGTTIGANRFLLLDSTGKIPAVDGSQVTTIAAGNIATGTIPIARIDTGTTANKIVKLDGNAKLPALDGSLLTNVSSSTNSASDPLITTNPSGGVGTQWNNTTSGEVYICTDATAGANVWTNVGAGSGDITPWQFGGTQYGYAAGGYPNSTQINRFSFASDGNATDHGDKFAHGANRFGGGTQSPTHGYITSGGTTVTISKFAFAGTGVTGTDVGDLTRVRDRPGTHATETYGFVSGGEPVDNGIERFSFTTDGNSTDWADMTTQRQNLVGSSSLTHGYNSCGYLGGMLNVIDRFPFATQTNATDVGDSTLARDSCASSSSTTHGYTAGGNASPNTNVIDKYGFSASNNATDVGDLTVTRQIMAGCSSTTYGYSMCGNPSSNVIDKYSFTTDGNATDVGDLLSAHDGMSGHHN